MSLVNSKKFSESVLEANQSVEECKKQVEDKFETMKLKIEAFFSNKVDCFRLLILSKQFKLSVAQYKDRINNFFVEITSLRSEIVKNNYSLYYIKSELSKSLSMFNCFGRQLVRMNNLPPTTVLNVESSTYKGDITRITQGRELYKSRNIDLIRSIIILYFDRTEETVRNRLLELGALKCSNCLCDFKREVNVFEEENKNLLSVIQDENKHARFTVRQLLFEINIDSRLVESEFLFDLSPWRAKIKNIMNEASKHCNFVEEYILKLENFLESFIQTVACEKFVEFYKILMEYQKECCVVLSRRAEEFVTLERIIFDEIEALKNEKFHKCEAYAQYFRKFLLQKNFELQEVFFRLDSMLILIKKARGYNEQLVDFDAFTQLETFLSIEESLSEIQVFSEDIFDIKVEDLLEVMLSMFQFLKNEEEEIEETFETLIPIVTAIETQYEEICINDSCFLNFCSDIDELFKDVNLCKKQMDSSFSFFVKFKFYTLFYFCFSAFKHQTREWYASTSALLNKRLMSIKSEISSSSDFVALCEERRKDNAARVIEINAEIVSCFHDLLSTVDFQGFIKNRF